MALHEQLRACNEKLQHEMKTNYDLTEKNDELKRQLKRVFFFKFILFTGEKLRCLNYKSTQESEQNANMVQTDLLRREEKRRLAAEQDVEELLV